MAVSNAAVFETRFASGNDLNSGGYVTTSGGTDYSQQASPHVTFDGVTILAVTSGASATITITGYTVATTDKGNLHRISGGTNFTAGLYQITSVNVGSNTWTFDRNCSTGVGAAMTGRMGGALATLVQFFADVDANTLVSGGYVCWAVGTYTVTSAVTITGNYNTNVAGSNTAANLGGVAVYGYTTTRGDNGQFTMTTATNSVDLLHCSSTMSNVTFYNANFTTSAGTVGYGATPTTSSSIPGRTAFVNCKWTGFKRAIWADGPSNAGYFGPLLLQNCVWTGCTTDGVVNGSLTIAMNCYGYTNTGDGIRAENNFATPTAILICIDCTFYNNTGKGIINNCAAGQRSSSNSTVAINCNLVSNGSDGFKATISGNNGCPTVILQNNIIYGNGGFGVNSDSLYGVLIGGNNAYGSNTSGAYGGSLAALPGDVSLSGDPFNGRTTNDFSRNSTAGAGAACAATGFPGALQLGGTGYADIGALQNAPGSSPFIRTDMMNGGF